MQVAGTRRSFELTAPDGTDLAAVRFDVAAPLRAVVALAHGKDEHQGRYAHVVAALTAAGYAVYTIDHRGHGASGGKRGEIRRFDDYVEDFDLLVREAERDHPNVPVVVLGHSMGGLIATRYALRTQDRLAALVLSGPALLVATDVPAWMKQVLKRVGAVLPNLKAPAGVPDLLSRDPEVQRAFSLDPLCNNTPTKLGFVQQLVAASDRTRREMHAIRLPLLVMHGEADRLTSPEGSKQLVLEAASGDKTLKLWPDDKHEIFNELDQADVIAYMIAWLDARFPVRES